MFQSAAQKQLLKTRLEAALGPIDGGGAAEKIAQTIVEWMEQDVLPILMVSPGIPTAGGPTNQVTIAPGFVK